MNFAEIRFWQLLCGGLAVIFFLRFWIKNPTERFDKLALLSLGLFLLMCVSGITFLIFTVVAVGSYFGLKWILEIHGRAPIRYLFVLIPLQLLPLLFYKYGDFFLHRVFHWNLTSAHMWLNGVTGHDVPALRDLIIPVGISFYTFQKVGFVVDTLVFKEPLPRFLDYMNFAGFFPQIVAGPIERRNSLLPQMEQFRFRWNRENIDDGASWIALGLFFKCCLADNLAVLFNPSSVTNPYLIWIANLLFGLRIYYDFAGYSLVALGLARCLGIQLTLNFASPYCSQSATEFWRRWHISLSQWFRDYLYIPLGGGRVTWWAFNIALVFTVSGLWHGAGWGFVLWGAMHGLFLIINRLSRPFIKIPALLGWALTTLAAFCAWLCFYETRTEVLLLKLKTLFTPGAYNLASFAAIKSSGIDFVSLRGFLLLVAIVFAIEWLSLAKKDEPYYFLRRPSVTVILVVLTIFLAPESNNGFIYFAF